MTLASSMASDLRALADLIEAHPSYALMFVGSFDSTAVFPTPFAIEPSDVVESLAQIAEPKPAKRQSVLRCDYEVTEMVLRGEMISVRVFDPVPA